MFDSTIDNGWTDDAYKNGGINANVSYNLNKSFPNL